MTTDLQYLTRGVVIKMANLRYLTRGWSYDYGGHTTMGGGNVPIDCHKGTDDKRILKQLLGGGKVVGWVGRDR